MSLTTDWAPMLRQESKKDLPPPPPLPRVAPAPESLPAAFVSKSSTAVAQPGLQNETGEYNCFLNVIIQCLWHCSDFRTRLLSWPPHYEHGKPAHQPSVNLRVLPVHHLRHQRCGDCTHVARLHHCALATCTAVQYVGLVGHSCCMTSLDWFNRGAKGVSMDTQLTGRLRRCSRSSASLQRTSAPVTRRVRMRWPSAPSLTQRSCGGRWPCRTRRTSR